MRILSVGIVRASEDSCNNALLTRDIMRLLFLLEGCRACADRSARMDWGLRGRVLGLEKQ